MDYKHFQAKVCFLAPYYPSLWDAKDDITFGFEILIYGLFFHTKMFHYCIKSFI